MFFLFADVICVFADDFGSVNNAINRLKVWATIGSASGLSRITRPRLISVASENSVSPIHDSLEMGEIETNLGSGDSPELQNAFSAIVLLQLAGDCLSPLSRHRQLKESIMRQTDEMQAIRKQIGAFPLCCPLEQSIFQGDLVYRTNNNTSILSYQNKSRG